MNRNYGRRAPAAWGSRSSSSRCAAGRRPARCFSEQNYSRELHIQKRRDPAAEKDTSGIPTRGSDLLEVLGGFIAGMNRLREGGFLWSLSAFGRGGNATIWSLRRLRWVFLLCGAEFSHQYFGTYIWCVAPPSRRPSLVPRRFVIIGLRPLGQFLCARRGAAPGGVVSDAGQDGLRHDLRRHHAVVDVRGLHGAFRVEVELELDVFVKMASS